MWRLHGYSERSAGGISRIFHLFAAVFFDLYSYSDDPRDLSNCRSYKEFLTQFGYLAAELFRALASGRIVAVHCMDLPTYKRNGEEIGLKDFSGDIIRLFQEHGFVFHSRHCIWKDPLIAAVRTHAVGLAHQQLVKDSAIVRTGIPDYLLAFRKPGENAKPINNENGLTVYYGERSVPKQLKMHTDPRKNKRAHWIWQQYASPVWFDIDQTRVLPYRQAKDKDDARHICPLQLDVIERCMALWSAPDDVVFSPFMGVGSEIYVAVKNGRKGIGAELKKSYYRQAVANVEHAARLYRQSTGDNDA